MGHPTNIMYSVLYSTSYTSGVAQIGNEFDQSETIVTLGLTFYLIGLAIGSMFMAPLSEVYGRKPVCVVCLAIFTILIIPCALAKSVTTLIVIRFLNAFFGSVMISTAPGMVADLVDDEHRSLAISIWSIGPLNGPGLFILCFSVSRNAQLLISQYSLGPCHWRLRHSVSGLALDVLDRTHALRRGLGFRLYSEGDICAYPAAEEGQASS